MAMTVARWVLATLVAAMSIVTAQDRDVDDLIRKLGSERVEDRDAASAKLVEAGERALPALERALKGASDELRLRLQAVISAVRVRMEQAELESMGIYKHIADTLPTLLKLIKSGDEEGLAQLVGSAFGFDEQTQKWSGTPLIRDAHERECILRAVVRRAKGDALRLLVMKAINAQHLQMHAEVLGFCESKDRRLHTQLLEFAGKWGLPGGEPYLLAKVKDGNRDEQVLAMRGLVETLTPAARAAIPAGLTHTNPGVRAVAARAVGPLSMASRPPLRELLDDPDEQVRVAAIASLRALGDREAAVAIVKLAGAGASLDQRHQAVWAIASLEIQEGADAVLAALAEPPRETREEAQLVRSAVHAAMRLRLVKAVPRLMELLLQNDSESLNAAFAIREIGSNASEEALLKICAGSDPSLRALAAYALGNNPKAMPWLLLSLEEEKIPVDGIWERGLSGPQVMEALRKGVAKASKTAAMRVADALVRSLAPEADAILADLVASEETETKCAALNAIAAKGRSNGVSVCKSQLSHKDPEVRAAALMAFSACAGSRALPELAVRLRDPEAPVRQAAVNCVETYGVLARSAVTPVFEQLGEAEQREMLNCLDDPALDAKAATWKEGAVRRLAVVRMLKRESPDGVAAARKASAEGNRPFYLLALATHAQDRDAARELIAFLKSEAGAEKHLRTLLDGKFDLFAMEMTLDTLIKEGPPSAPDTPVALSAIETASKSPLPLVRAEAANALLPTHTGSAPVLTALLTDPCALVRRAAVWRIGFLQPRDLPKAFAASLWDPDHKVRREALKAVPKCDPSLVSHALEQNLVERFGAFELIDVCAQYRIPVDTELLRGELRGSVEAWTELTGRSGERSLLPAARYAVRLGAGPSAFVACAKLGDESALTELRNLLGAGPMAQSWKAARGLVELGDDVSYPTILKLLRESDMPSKERNELVLALNALQSNKDASARIDIRGFSGTRRGLLDLVGKALGRKVRVHESCQAALLDERYFGDGQLMFAELANQVPFTVVLTDDALLVTSHEYAVDHWQRWLDQRKK